MRCLLLRCRTALPMIALWSALLLHYFHVSCKSVGAVELCCLCCSREWYVGMGIVSQNRADKTESTLTYACAPVVVYVATEPWRSHVMWSGLWRCLNSPLEAYSHMIQKAWNWVCPVAPHMASRKFEVSRDWPGLTHWRAFEECYAIAQRQVRKCRLAFSCVATVHLVTNLTEMGPAHRDEDWVVSPVCV